MRTDLLSISTIPYYILDLQHMLLYFDLHICSEIAVPLRGGVKLLMHFVSIFGMKLPSLAGNCPCAEVYFVCMK